MKYAPRRTIVIKKQSKSIEAYSTLLINFSRKHMMFGEVDSVLVERRYGRTLDHFHILVVGLQKTSIEVGVFVNQSKAVEFTDMISRTIGAKITYGGYWGLGKTGPES